jgi:hypothetical protein
LVQGQIYERSGQQCDIRVLCLEAGDVENDLFVEKRLGTLDEWQAIVDDLRQRYPGRKVLMRMLDAL